jgi:hypothetical protein
MEKKQQTSPSGHVVIVRGADDQRAALERMWAQGEQVDPEADEAACFLHGSHSARNASRLGMISSLLGGCCARIVDDTLYSTEKWRA